MRNIEQKEFDEWLTHPVTLAVKEMYAEKSLELMKAWRAWAFVNSTAEAYAIQNAGEAARAQVYDEFAQMSYESYLTEKHNEERIGLEPQGESRVD